MDTVFSAFLSAWQRCFPQLRKYALELTGNEHDAEDLCMETFLRAASRRPDHEWMTCSWFKSILFHIFIDKKREAKPLVILDEDEQKRLFENLPGESNEITELFDDTSIAEAIAEAQARICLQELMDQAQQGSGQFSIEDVLLFQVYQLQEGMFKALEQLTASTNNLLLSDVIDHMQSVLWSIFVHFDAGDALEKFERELEDLSSDNKSTDVRAACVRLLLGLGDPIENLVAVTGKSARDIKNTVDAVERAVRDCFAEFIGDLPLSEATTDAQETVRKAEFDQEFDTCLADLVTDYSAIPKQLRRLLCFQRYYSVANRDLRWTLTEVAAHYGIAVGTASRDISQVSDDFCARFAQNFPGARDALVMSWQRKSHISPKEKAKLFSHREELILRCADIKVPRAGR